MLSKRDMVIQDGDYLEHSHKTLSTICICYHNVLLKHYWLQRGFVVYSSFLPESHVVFADL